MNKIIEQQLKQLKVATIDSYDEVKHTYTFKKHQGNIFKVDSFYLLELDDTLLDPNNNDILRSNWNGGKYPKHKYLKAQVTKIVGKMIYLSGVFCDSITKTPINEHWVGWLPDEQVKILEEV